MLDITIQNIYEPSAWIPFHIAALSAIVCDTYTTVKTQPD